MILEPGKEYTLKYSGEFCHRLGTNGYVDFNRTMGSEDRIKCLFVGTVPSDLGPRNIFINSTHGPDVFYMMFGADNLDYIV